MPNRMTQTARALAAGLVLAVAGAPGAVAQQDLVAEEVWDRFAEICSAAVADDAPAMFLTRLDGVEGAASQSADGRVRNAVAEMTAPEFGDLQAVMTISVNDYDGGRAVYCMLQLIGPDGGPAGLGDVARDRAEQVLGAGETLVSAGGPVTGAATDGRLFGAQEGAEAVRVSTEGFPPRAVLHVQVSPRFTMLAVDVRQPAAAE